MCIFPVFFCRLHELQYFGHCLGFALQGPKLLGFRRIYHLLDQLLPVISQTVQEEREVSIAPQTGDGLSQLRVLFQPPTPPLPKLPFEPPPTPLVP